MMQCTTIYNCVRPCKFLLILAIFGRTFSAGENITSDDDLEDRFGFSDFFDPSSRIECRNGFGQTGLCVPLRNCPVLRTQVRHLNPGRVFQYLLDYTFPCTVRGQVCCPGRRTDWGGMVTTPNPMTTEDQKWTWPEGGLNPPWTPPPTPKSLQTTRPQEGGKIPKKTGIKVTISPLDGPKMKHKNRRLLPENNCGIDLGNRVLGGEETSLEEHPWLALLRMRLPNGKAVFICGGTVINSKYILTAAHCLKGIGIPDGGVLDMVRLGEHNTNTGKDCTAGGHCASPPQNIGVEKRIVHPEFTPRDAGTFNDIALLRLKKDIKFNVYVQPACLPLDAIALKKYDGKKLTTVGWGRTSNDEKFNSPTKQKVQVPVITFSECVPQYLARKINLRDTQLCAGGEAGKDSCQGDSGGPLLSQDLVDQELRWYIQGIVSTGPKECGKSNNPAIYTRVSKYIAWILDNIHE